MMEYIEALFGVQIGASYSPVSGEGPVQVFGFDFSKGSDDPLVQYTYLEAKGTYGKTKVSSFRKLFQPCSLQRVA